MVAPGCPGRGRVGSSGQCGVSVPPSLQAAWARFVPDVRPDERPALRCAFASFFCLLAGYYVLRPLREEMGIRAGVDRISDLYLGTFLAAIVIVPAWSMVVSRFERRRLIPIAWRACAVVLLGFWAAFALAPPSLEIPVIYAFFAWVSVFNLVAVSIFWSGLVDLFDSEQGSRLFGVVAAGGSAGALVGSVLTMLFGKALATIHLIAIPVVLLEIAARSFRRLERRRPPGSRREDEVVRGDLLRSLKRLLRTPYLLGICLYHVFFSLSATFFYFQQSHLVASAQMASADRTWLFAWMNLWVQVVTGLAQAFGTPKWIVRFGLAVTLGVLPAVHCLGFLGLATIPSLGLFVVIEVLRRSAEYGIASPSRQVLYTVVSRDEKYRTKNFIDTVVLRTSDVVSGQLFDLLRGLGLGLQAISWVAVPLGLPWLVLGSALAGGHRRRSPPPGGEGEPAGTGRSSG